MTSKPKQQMPQFQQQAFTAAALQQLTAVSHPNIISALQPGNNIYCLFQVH